MKRFLIIFLILILPFLIPVSIFAQSNIPDPNTTPTITVTLTPTNDTSTTQPNIWNLFWSWVFGIFAKTDYSINPNRTSAQINSDMTDYGDLNSPENKEKHSFAGSRSTDSNTQNCFKGNVIKKVILNISGYPDTKLSKICFDSTNSSQTCQIKTLNDSTENLTCTEKTIKDLSHYFVQLQKQFYCTNNNVLMNTEQNVVDEVNKFYTTSIPQNELGCYQAIYEDLYLTPKDTTDNEEENTKKMMQTPISNKDQNSTNNNSDIKNQLNKNFSPEGTTGGLGGLRPAGW